MSSVWDFVWVALFLAVALGQSEDPFAEFDTDETVVIEPDDYDIEVENSPEEPVAAPEPDSLDDQVVIEDEDFEGINPSDKPPSGNNELNIVNAPVNMKGHWEDYYLEIIGLIGVFVYALNFYTGKSINNRLANAWFEHHKKLLSDAFCIVGDDGVSKEISEDMLVKESENRFVLWCTGRLGCEGIKIEIKLLRRQDLISVLSQIFKPQSDTITITTYLSPDDMDSVVLAVMPRKGLKRLQQEVQDLAHFATEKKTDKFDLPSQLGILAEFSEVSNEFLSAPVCKTISENIDVFDSIHFSDYYTGFKISQESQTETERPKPVKRLIFNFVIPGHGKRTKSSIMETTEPLVRMALHMMVKVHKFKLSKENKNKAEKHRIQVEEEYLKQTHTQRQEAAQARRDERKRMEKEKIQELDPEAQRRYEEREYKKSMRRSGPRVKQLKVKTG